MADLREGALRITSYSSSSTDKIVALIGSPPQSITTLRDGLGVFERREERINGAPSYALLGSGGKTLLWRTLPATGGMLWYIGSQECAGSDRGDFRSRATVIQQKADTFIDLIARSTVPTPDVGTVLWEVLAEDGESWVEAPAVRCIASTPVQAESDAAPELMALVGSTPNQLQRDCLGLFARRPGVLIDGYPCYEIIGSDGHDLLWHHGSCWIVGNAEDVGTSIGGMLACSGELRPDAIRTTWRVMGYDSKWVQAPNVECITGERLEHEIQSAARTIALVGATPRRVKPLAEVFERLPRAVNGLATYVMRSDAPDKPPVLLWHASGCWLVGSMAASVSSAQMRAADGALRPECIEATWEVWDSSGQSWVEAPALRCLSRDAVVEAVEKA